MFDGFWENVSRYFSYFITITLGIFLNALAPIIPLFKRPITAVPLMGLLIGMLLFFYFTLRAMLGLTAV